MGIIPSRNLDEQRREQNGVVYFDRGVIEGKDGRKYSRFAVDRGYIPIAPHLLFPQFLNDKNPAERRLGLFMGQVLLTKCAELWVFGDRISPGMEGEIARAGARGMPVRYFDENMEEYARG